MYDCIIIGAGPAGLSAAIYLSRANKKVLLIDKNGYGGQIINALDIENYPGCFHINGFDLVNKMYEQAINLGTEYLQDEVLSFNNSSVTTKKRTYACKTIILAMGASNRRLDIPNIDKYIGKGISYCATCDGAFYRGKTVAIVGGGNTAIDDAVYLSNLANKVYIIYRGNKFRYDVSKLEKKDNVEFILNNNVVGINGNEKIESVKLDNHEDIKVDGLFIAIGQVPNTNFVKDINLNDKGYIISNEDCATNIPNIFVAGDVREKSLRQVVTASSDGAIAANNVINYLNK